MRDVTLLTPFPFGFLSLFLSHVPGFGCARAVARESMRPSMCHMIAAVTAGAASTLLCSPIWVAKTRLQAQVVSPEEYSQRHYRHTFPTVWKIWRREGFMTLYRGLVPSLCGLLHVAIQFPCYEALKKFLQDRRLSLSHSLSLLLLPLSFLLFSLSLPLPPSLLSLLSCSLSFSFPFPLFVLGTRTERRNP